MLGLTGCTSLPKDPIEINKNEHQIKLAEYEQWKIRGRLAFKSPEEKNFSASLNWQQQKTSFTLRLSSVIGTSLMKMRGRPGFAELQADDKTYTDTDASALIRRVTGWNIPISNFSSWIKGQVKPGDYAEWDQIGLVRKLSPLCQGCEEWTISFSHYKQKDDVWLPHEVRLNNKLKPGNNIKIRISSWNKS